MACYVCKGGANFDFFPDFFKFLYFLADTTNGAASAWGEKTPKNACESLSNANDVRSDTLWAVK